MSGITHPAQVEGELIRLSNSLDDVTEQMADAAQAHAEADIAYRQKFNRALVTSTARASDMRRAEAESAAAEEYATMLIALAKLRALRDAGHNVRAQLDALRSVNSNVRQASGLGR